jgi:TonB family protein
MVQPFPRLSELIPVPPQILSRCAVVFVALYLAVPGIAQPDKNEHPAAADNGDERPVPVGKGVQPPRVLYQPDPDYSEEARRSGTSGMVLLSLIVGRDGAPRDIKIVMPLGGGLDENAINAVKTWKFDPATKNGKPVAVQLMIEVQFRLYSDAQVGKVDVVGDPLGVNFNAYLAPVILEAGKCWNKAIEDKTHAPGIKQGQVTVQFAIKKDGRLGTVELTSPSGDDVLDRDARTCVAALKGKPLPVEFKGREVGVRMQLLYKLQGVELAPSRPQITAGHDKQFYMELAGIVSEVAEWSVSGPGCTGAACGTVSADGLYTAPTDLPEPPIVRVKGTLAGANAMAASAVVTLVRAR